MNTLENSTSSGEKWDLQGYTLFNSFYLKNIDCGCSLEQPPPGGSNKHRQSIFEAIIRKILLVINDGECFHPYILEGSICYLRGIRCNILGLFGSRQKMLLANSGDPDQMPHHAASDLGLPVCPCTPFLTTLVNEHHFCPGA